MSRELWLLRHGHAEHNGVTIDIDRRLDARGEKEVRQMGGWMAQEGLIPDVVISSPASRAFATAQGIVDSLNLNNMSIIQEKRLYFQGVLTIKTVLSELPSTPQRLLLVGHNPDFENLLVDLVGTNVLSKGNELLPTATLARLSMPDDWKTLSAKCADLIALTTVASLK